MKKLASVFLSITALSALASSGVASERLYSPLENNRYIDTAIVQPDLNSLDNAISSQSFQDPGILYADNKPSQSACNKAIKLLTQYSRLAQKYNIKISDRRIRQLNEKRDNGTITDNDLPGKLYREFPGIFRGKTLRQIRAVCNRPVPAS